MANFKDLIALLKQDIKTNGIGSITGQLLQDNLVRILNTLSKGAIYKGVATLTTSPTDVDANSFYLAVTPGTYTNFGNLSVTDDEIYIFKNNSGSWVKDSTGITTKSYVDGKLDLKADKTALAQSDAKIVQLEQNMDKKLISSFDKITPYTEFPLNNFTLTNGVLRCTTEAGKGQYVQFDRYGEIGRPYRVKIKARYISGAKSSLLIGFGFGSAVSSGWNNAVLVNNSGHSYYTIEYNKLSTEFKEFDFNVIAFESPIFRIGCNSSQNNGMVFEIADIRVEQYYLRESSNYVSIPFSSNKKDFIAYTEFPLNNFTLTNGVLRCTTEANKGQYVGHCKPFKLNAFYKVKIKARYVSGIKSALIVGFGFGKTYGTGITDSNRLCPSILAGYYTIPPDNLTSEFKEFEFKVVSTDSPIFRIGCQSTQNNGMVFEIADVSISVSDNAECVEHLNALNNYECIRSSNAQLYKSNALKPLRILTIGNSFSIDAEEHLNDLLRAAGIDYQIGFLYIGSGTLEQHYNNYMSRAAPYDFYFGINGADWAITPNYPIQQALEQYEWDIVVFQQQSGRSGMYDTFQPYLNNLISEIKKNYPHIKYAWHQTWAYASNSTHGDFSNYNNNQQQMFEAIISSGNRVINETEAKILIPSGLFIQAARNLGYNYGNELTVDGYHLDQGIGRMIASYAWVKTFFTENICGNWAVPKNNTRVDYAKLIEIQSKLNDLA